METDAIQQMSDAIARVRAKRQAIDSTSTQLADGPALAILSKQQHLVGQPHAVQRNQQLRQKVDQLVAKAKSRPGLSLQDEAQFLAVQHGYLSVAQREYGQYLQQVAAARHQRERMAELSKILDRQEHQELATLTNARIRGATEAVTPLQPVDAPRAPNVDVAAFLRTTRRHLQESLDAAAADAAAAATAAAEAAAARTAARSSSPPQRTLDQLTHMHRNQRDTHRDWWDDYGNERDTRRDRRDDYGNERDNRDGGHRSSHRKARATASPRRRTRSREQTPDARDVAAATAALSSPEQQSAVQLLQKVLQPFLQQGSTTAASSAMPTVAWFGNTGSDGTLQPLDPRSINFSPSQPQPTDPRIPPSVSMSPPPQQQQQHANLTYSSPPSSGGAAVASLSQQAEASAGQAAAPPSTQPASPPPLHHAQGQPSHQPPPASPPPFSSVGGYSPPSPSYFQPPSAGGTYPPYIQPPSGGGVYPPPAGRTYPPYSSWPMAGGWSPPFYQAGPSAYPPAPMDPASAFLMHPPPLFTPAYGYEYMLMPPGQPTALGQQYHSSIPGYSQHFSAEPPTATAANPSAAAAVTADPVAALENAEAGQAVPPQDLPPTQQGAAAVQAGQPADADTARLLPATAVPNYTAQSSLPSTQTVQLPSVPVTTPSVAVTAPSVAATAPSAFSGAAAAAVDAPPSVTLPRAVDLIPELAGTWADTLGNDARRFTSADSLTLAHGAAVVALQAASSLQTAPSLSSQGTIEAASGLERVSSLGGLEGSGSLVLQPSHRPLSGSYSSPRPLMEAGRTSIKGSRLDLVPQRSDGGSSTGEGRPTPVLHHPSAANGPPSSAGNSAAAESHPPPLSASSSQRATQEALLAKSSSAGSHRLATVAGGVSRQASSAAARTSSELESPETSAAIVPPPSPRPQQQDAMSHDSIVSVSRLHSDSGSGADDEDMFDRARTKDWDQKLVAVPEKASATAFPSTPRARSAQMLPGAAIVGLDSLRPHGSHDKDIAVGGMASRPANAVHQQPVSVGMSSVSSLHLPTSPHSNTVSRTASVASRTASHVPLKTSLDDAQAAGAAGFGSSSLVSLVTALTSMPPLSAVPGGTQAAAGGTSAVLLSQSSYKHSGTSQSQMKLDMDIFNTSSQGGDLGRLSIKSITSPGSRRPSTPPRSPSSAYAGGSYHPASPPGSGAIGGSYHPASPQGSAALQHLLTTQYSDASEGNTSGTLGVGRAGSGTDGGGLRPMPSVVRLGSIASFSSGAGVTIENVTLARSSGGGTGGTGSQKIPRSSAAGTSAAALAAAAAGLNGGSSSIAVSRIFSKVHRANDEFASSSEDEDGEDLDLPGLSSMKSNQWGGASLHKTQSIRNASAVHNNLSREAEDDDDFGF